MILQRSAESSVTENPVKRMERSVPATHVNDISPEFPTMGSEWTRLSDSGNVQRYLSGGNSTFTYTVLGATRGTTNTITCRVPPRSIVLIQDASRGFADPRIKWFVSYPKETKYGAGDTDAPGTDDAINNGTPTREV